MIGSCESKWQRHPHESRGASSRAVRAKVAAHLPVRFERTAGARLHVPAPRLRDERSDQVIQKPVSPSAVHLPFFFSSTSTAPE